MAIPEDHLVKFQKISDAKNIWEAIKSRFGRNDEPNKMQKYLLKQQFESFSVSNSKGLHKGYDRFQSLLSQLKTHGACVSTEDANQKFLSGPQLDHEDLKQVDEFDLEEMDLKWQVAMISTRLKKFYKKTGRKLHFDAKEPIGFDKSKDEHKAMLTIDGKGVDWTCYAKDETEGYALMAFNSNKSGSDTEVTCCSKVCEESYAKLKKLYDEQREQLSVLLV
uniref:Ribonuclease H-like domain-containing protein n=1 Tax=Tanacetum cinerariifolium TaxID=118510 RepID=A0A699JKS8_TANCI|nr:ribonuclease H-like domain-containing protein [Tanacetum cinerariifolium]